MFYYQSVGECVSQVYDIEASTWEEAKKAAWKWMDEGDILAECGGDAIEDQHDGEYHTINEEKASNYAFLNCGAWVNTPDGGDDFREDIWYWSDEPEEYLNADGEPYDFKRMEEEYRKMQEEEEE